MKHKHAEIIKAFVDGIECQYWCTDSLRWISFVEIAYFSWAYDVRIKPEPIKEQEPQYLYMYRDRSNNISVYHTMMAELYNNWFYMGKVKVEK